MMPAPDADDDGFQADEDCDDADSQINPEARESCDGVDNDCDDAVDDADEDLDENTLTTWYLDADLDGWGVEQSAISRCSPPTEYWTQAYGDCDNEDVSINPGAEERCDGLDQDCDGEVDEEAGEATYWYTDEDGDGYGDEDSGVRSCNQPEGMIATGGDCDDSDPAYHPGADETDCEDPSDYNCDGSVGYDDRDDDGFAACIDCDDRDADVYPNADEVCDEIDNDCDSDVDEGAIDAATWFEDADADGFGDPDATASACTAPDGYVADDDDCDDDDAHVNPDGTERCNGYDDNCDGETDEAGSADETDWYRDADADGFGDPDATASACTAPDGYVADDDDCDDGDASVSPASDEVCDRADNDCDGETDEEDAADAPTWYADVDDDSYGDEDAARVACDMPSGHVSDRNDCDDRDSEVYPGANETCDGEDNDCDGETDEDDAIDAATWYADTDGDGFGGSAATRSCDAVPADGYATTSSDCDDRDRAIYPGAPEYCEDGKDNDCDGEIDEDDAIDAATWYADTDGDGYGDRETTSAACTVPEGHISNHLDCDDSDSRVYPYSSSGGVRGDPEGWPRLGALWLAWNEDGAPHWCEAASYSLATDGGFLGVIASAYPDDVGTEEGAADLLHALNPEIVLLQNMLGTEYLPGGPIDPEGEVSCWSDAHDLLYDMDGDPVLSWGDTLDVVDITDEDTRACVISFNVAAALNDARWNPDATRAIYDGLYLVSTTTGAQHILLDDAGDPVPFDWDGDGVQDDYDNVAHTWAESIVDFVQNMIGDSAFSAYDIPIHTSGYSLVGSRAPLWDQVAGILQPNHWTNAYEGTYSEFSRAEFWRRTLYVERLQAEHVSGVSLALMTGDTDITAGDPTMTDASTYADVRDDYQRMRYGLCSALLAGMAYTYEWGEGGHGQGWWYDEYDNAGEGIGYLGQPLTEAQPVELSIGTELLSNGSLSRSASRWSSYTCDADTTSGCAYSYDNSMSWDGSEDAEGSTSSGSLWFSIEQEEDADKFIWDVIVYQDGISAVADSDYVLRFSARTENSSDPEKSIRGVQPYIQRVYTDGAGTTWYETVDYAPMLLIDETWRSFIVPLSTESLGVSSTTSLRVALAFGNHDGEVWIDSLSFARGDVSGTWYREFEDGLVLLNSGDEDEPVTLADIAEDPSWDRIAGTQDTTANDGATGVEEQVVPSMDGRILLRR